MKLWIRIGLAATAVIAGFVITLLLLADQRNEEALRREHDHTAALVAEHIAEDAAQPLLAGDRDGMTARLKEHLDRNDDIVYLFVRDDAGNVIAHTFSGRPPREIVEAGGLSPGRERTVVQAANGAAPRAAVRIAKGASAELHAGFSDKRRQETVRAIHRELLLTGVLFIALGGFLGFSSSYVMMRPLRDVMNGMEIIGSGNLSHRIAVSGTGEAAMLARVFNDMADKRQEAEARTVQLGFELDERVQQRTEQLEAANREMEAFSYSVSHDLRAPLRSIDGFSKALLDDYADKFDAEGRDYLRRVRKASQRMGQLIDDILKLSRLTRGEMLLEQVDISALVREVSRPLAESNAGRKIKLHVQEGLAARADRKMLRVVLENLLSNAWKYTAKQPVAWVTFGMAPSSRGAAYFVKDNGAGFDMAFSQKLFAPFQRLHADKDFPGTGIGLATVQRIVHRHGGEIWAESEPGKGATFYFTLGSGNA